ncbi:acyltransferase family protein [Clostridium perfringens]
MSLESEKKSQKMFSNKLVHVSFILSIIVIYIHANNLKYYGLEMNVNNLAYWIEKFLGSGIGESVVPLFFIISGFLFFKNIDLNEKCYLKYIIFKQLKRSKTIVIPYLFWNSFGTMFYLLIPKIPVISSFFNYNEVNINLFNILEGIVLFKYYFPLWYLGYLIILVILTPIFAILIKNKNIAVFSVVILGIIYLSGNNFFFLSVSSIFFFLLGSVLAIHFPSIFVDAKKRKIVNICIVFFLVLSFLKVITINVLVNRILYLILPIILWFAFDLFLINKEPFNFEKQSFFIYCSHIIIVTSVNKILLKVGNLLELNEIWIVLSYIIAPVITLFIIYIIYIIMKNNFSMFYKFICGNRG